jgi:uroporphyrinogen-III synthase
VTVVVFERQGAEATRRCVGRRGGTVLSAPAAEAPPARDAVLDVAAGLLDGTVDVVCFTTAAGPGVLFDVLESRHDLDAVRSALGDAVVGACCPAARDALSARGVAVDVMIAEQSSTQAVVDALTGHPRGPALDGARLAVQADGRPGGALPDAPRVEGADLTPLPLERGPLPDDRQPLRNAIRALIGGEAQVALFTSRAQVDHVLQTADDRGWSRTLRTALHEDALVASLGPIATRTLRARDLPVHVEPDRAARDSLIDALASTVPTFFQPAPV